VTLSDADLLILYARSGAVLARAAPKSPPNDSESEIEENDSESESDEDHGVSDSEPVESLVYPTDEESESSSDDSQSLSDEGGGGFSL
jgi:hypothetical protein